MFSTLETARCVARAKTYVRVGPARTASSRFSEQRVWPQSMQISQVGPTVMRCILGSGSPFSETHFCRPNFKISGHGKCKNCVLKLVSESGRCCKFKYLGSKSTIFQRHLNFVFQRQKIGSGRWLPELKPSLWERVQACIFFDVPSLAEGRYACALAIFLLRYLCQ
jgi:hypothetical protein